MSLLTVLYRPFPRFVLAFCSHQDPPRLPHPLHEVGATAQARPLAGVSLAERLTQPKLANFFSNMDPEHTPINIPDSHHNFLCPDDATVIPTSPEGLQDSGASSSSKQTAASRGPSLFGSSRFWKQGACHVSGPSETEAECDREPVATTLFSSQSKGKRDRDTNVVHSLRDRESLQKILEGKVDVAVRGERVAQQKLFEAQAVARNCEKTSSEIDFQEIIQQQLHEAEAEVEATCWERRNSDIVFMR